MKKLNLLKNQLSEERKETLTNTKNIFFLTILRIYWCSKIYKTAGCKIFNEYRFAVKIRVFKHALHKMVIF